MQGSSECYCDHSVSFHAGWEAPAVRTLRPRGTEGKTDTNEGQGQRDLARLERRAILAGSGPGSVVKQRALELEYLHSVLGLTSCYFLEFEQIISPLCPHVQNGTNDSDRPRGCG